jgi:hypothetical protein
MLHPFSIALLVCAALAPATAWPADPADPAAMVPSIRHGSAIDGYRSHAPEPVGSWRDANERVARQAGAHAHGAQAAPSVGDPHAGHSAPVGAPADAAARHDHSMHDHGAHSPGAHDHSMHQRKPASDGAGKEPAHCKHHDTAGVGGGRSHAHAGCPMKKEGSHAHH